MTNTFNYHFAGPKQTTREMLLDKLPILSEAKPKLLTLPSDNFIFEDMVLTEYPDAVIDCMEYDRKLYIEVKDKVGQNINYEYGDIFDKASSNAEVYDMIWLDLCGNLSPSNINNLISVVQNSLKPKSVLAFTFTAGRENYMNNILEIYKCRSAKEFRFEFFPQFLTRMGKLTHPDFHITDIIKYKNNRGHSTPMCMYICQTFNPN